MTIIQELRAMSNDPKAQAGYAISLLNYRNSLDVILAALTALSEFPAPEAHQSLINLYSYYTANGPKRDPGAYTRRAVLDALRPVALPSDTSLLQDAVTTYEFLPPSFGEDAGLLRSGALLILNEIEEELSSYYAARLLVDGFTQEMSGEPALTAVRVLENQDHLLPLYQFVMTDVDPALFDVISEALRSLTRLPIELVPSLVERYGDSTNGVLLVGLYDLLINHHAGPQELDLLATALLSQQDLDIYRYLVITILSSRQIVLVSLLNDVVRMETNRQRIETVLEVADLYAADPDIANMARNLRANLS